MVLGHTISASCLVKPRFPIKVAGQAFCVVGHKCPIALSVDLHGEGLQTRGLC